MALSSRSGIQTIFRFSALLALLAASTALFFWLRFPSAALRVSLENAANRQLGPRISCRIAAVLPALPPAFELQSVRLFTSDPADRAVFFAGDIHVRPLVLPLCTGQGLVFSLTGKAYGGGFTARARLENGEKLRFENRLLFDHIDLSKNEYLNKTWDSPIAGILQGEITIPTGVTTHKATTTPARITFSVRDAALPFASPLPGLASISFTGVEGKAHVEADGIRVEKLELDAALLTMKLAGSIGSGGAGTDSRLALEGEMLPKSGKSGIADIFFAVLRSRDEKSGIPIRITGTTKKPEIHFSAP